MHINLVAMPWQLLELPSLALGILHSRILQARPEDTVTQFQGALAWSDFLLSETDDGLTPEDYTYVAQNGLHHGLGDWVFAGALYDEPEWRAADLAAYAERTGVDIDTVVRMRAHATAFVEETASSIVAARPDVVGFTTTFMQNVPSLAVARRVKRELPGTAVVMGGANCDGPMGHALHRNHRFVDFAVRGEGEQAFPALLEAIEAGRAPDRVPGVCWWDGDISVANPEAEGQVPPAHIPVPEFTPWQEAFETSPSRHWLEPKLVLEGARGCWWGEKHQCTFCGLNGSAITFRSKSAEQMWDELGGLVRKHRILDVIMVDNIIDMRYIDELLPRMAGSGWDLRLHYEVKSNLRHDQVSAFAEAGVVHIQPGIESLNKRVLSLMDKGVSGSRNVQLLRDCEDHGLTVSWNYLYGFPGEREADYLPVIDQMPALVHLQPPGEASRIALERFSPNFERPELGFPERTPSDIYDHIYDLPRHELEDLVYLFDTPHRGISGGTEKRLSEGIEEWKAAYPASRLTIVEESAGLCVIEDRRAGLPEADHTLHGWQARAYGLLSRGRNSAGLVKSLNDPDVSETEAEAWLASLRRRGLAFQDGDWFVALAHRGRPVRALPQPVAEAYA